MTQPQPEDPDCIICRKHRGDFNIPGGSIYSDDLVFACHAHLWDDKPDQYLGWLVLETRRHTPDLTSLTEAEALQIGRWARQLALILKDEVKAEKVYVFVIGEGVAHFHMHLIPRYPDAPREYWGSRVDEWPEAPRGGEAEIAALCSTLRKRIESLDRSNNLH
jgi:histidine triad (HIT) family protein